MKKLFILLIVVGFSVGCNQSKSLQSYLVEKQESNEFISLDVPASIVTLGENASEENKATLKSIKKINIVYFKLNEDNKEKFVTEREELKSILNGKDFNELMRVNNKETQIKVSYLGDESTIDELIVFASNDDQGFGLARVLGNHMQPEKIMKLIKDIEKIDQDNPAMASIKDLIN